MRARRWIARAPGRRARASKGASTRSSARDLREDEHFAVGLDRLQQGVLVDLAVDRDGHTFLKMGSERGMELGEPIEELLDGRRRDLELGDAPRQLREVADQNNPRHPRSFSSCRWRLFP